MSWIASAARPVDVTDSRDGPRAGLAVKGGTGKRNEGGVLAQGSYEYRCQDAKHSNARDVCMDRMDCMGSASPPGTEYSMHLGLFPGRSASPRCG